ncbi:hypothetical protein ACHAWF_006734 [Thalassiosira exigua]
MRFFGAKRERNKGGGGHRRDGSGEGGEAAAEARTDGATAAPSRRDRAAKKGVQGLLRRSPSPRSPRSRAGEGGREASAAPPAAPAGAKFPPGGTVGGPDAPQNRTPSPRHAPGRGGAGTSPRRKASGQAAPPPKVSFQGQGGGARSQASKSKSPASPPQSILHRNTHYGSPPSAKAKSPPGLNFEMPADRPAPAQPHVPRVRFFSSGGDSVASTEASQVHLMAGGGHSVASSTANSSSADPGRDNVFDRVLHSVMAEERDRLNALGMMGAARGPSPPRPRPGGASARGAGQAAAGEFPAAGPAKSSSEDVDDDETLGLIPPGRGDIGPVDIDTGREVAARPNVAPIDSDTGLELGESLGDNHLSPIDTDTGMEIALEGGGEPWKVFDAAFPGTEGSGKLGGERRCRSYDERRARPPGHSRDLSQGSDPGSPRGDWGERKKSPTGKGAGASRKAKKIWDRDKQDPPASDGWGAPVAF